MKLQKETNEDARHKYQPLCPNPTFGQKRDSSGVPVNKTFAATGVFHQSFVGSDRPRPAQSNAGPGASNGPPFKRTPLLKAAIRPPDNEKPKAPAKVESSRPDSAAAPVARKRPCETDDNLPGDRSSGAKRKKSNEPTTSDKKCQKPFSLTPSPKASTTWVIKPQGPRIGAPRQSRIAREPSPPLRAGGLKSFNHVFLFCSMTFLSFLCSPADHLDNRASPRTVRCLDWIFSAI